MTMQRRAMLFSIVAASGLAACGDAIDRRTMSGPPVAVAVLDASLNALKAAFNAAHDDVRLLFIAGPSCGPCLRGLMELNTALGPNLLADRRLRVFIVYVPTLGAEQSHALRAAHLLNGPSVTHFWDPSGKSGEAVQQALGISEYAWDVWLTYAPGPVWTGEAPPAPAAWMHQLGGLRQGVRLDANALARDVRSRVEQLA